MTDWFYLLTLVVVGCCNAFGSPELNLNLKNSGNWVRDLRALNRPIKKFSNLIHRDEHKRRFSTPNCIFRNEHLEENEIDAKENWSVIANTNLPISHQNKGDKLFRYHRSKFDTIKNLDPGTNGYDFNNRRLFWEAILDGNIIGSVGILFSKDIKSEANRERVERENMRNDALRKKYIDLMNDPEKLAELKRESANSPSHINQFIRRSFSQRFDERFRKNAAKKLSFGNRFDYTEPKRREILKKPLRDSYIFFKIMNGESKRHSGQELDKNSDHFTPSVQELKTNFLSHRPIVGTDRRRKNVEASTVWVSPRNWENPWTLLESRLNAMNKTLRNSQTSSIDDVISPINSFLILNILTRGCDLGLYTSSEIPSTEIRLEDLPVKGI